mmetsp:Transcript_42802/g.41144  ORF Transcript_42802/g.41144 Transcript_42802/m.41144 type:complete len:110 (+) Transcript_42802:1096-1425(+)
MTPLPQSFQRKEEEVHQLNAEKFKLNSELNLLQQRMEELVNCEQELNQLRTYHSQEMIKVQKLLADKDETIKKLKKKIVSFNLKDKIMASQEQPYGMVPGKEKAEIQDF